MPRYVTIFASSDFQPTYKPNGDIDLYAYKRGHIEGIIEKNKEAVEAGHATCFLYAGDATTQSTSGNIFDFQFYKNSSNLLGFGISNELKLHKKIVETPLKKANVPSFFTIGNHDVENSTLGKILHRNIPRTAVKDHFKSLHGGEFYVKKIGGINIVSLGLYPDKRALAWMEKNVPKDEPVFAFWHYNVAGAFSVGNGDKNATGALKQWWSPEERTAAFTFFKQYKRFIGANPGHYHRSEEYLYKDIRIILAGGAQFAEITIDTEDDYKVSVQFHSGKVSQRQALRAVSSGTREAAPEDDEFPEDLGNLRMN